MKYLSTQNERRRWRKRIKRQQESGKPITTWCTENSINVGQFHYWKRRLFPKPVEQVSSNDCSHQFIELTDAGSSNSRSVQQVIIVLGNDFDAQSLKKVLASVIEESCSP